MLPLHHAGSLLILLLPLHGGALILLLALPGSGLTGSGPGLGAWLLVRTRLPIASRVPLPALGISGGGATGRGSRAAGVMSLPAGAAGALARGITGGGAATGRGAATGVMSLPAGAAGALARGITGGGATTGRGAATGVMPLPAGGAVTPAAVITIIPGGMTGGNGVIAMPTVISSVPTAVMVLPS